jgi:hypothetical protein
MMLGRSSIVARARGPVAGGLVLGLWLSAGAGSATAQTVPFTERFQSGPANWYNADLSALATAFATGGPASSASYASVTYSFLDASPNPQTPPVILQTRPGFNSSGNRFFGNWIASGVTAFSFAVRHSVPATLVPGGLTFFARFAATGNFPGAVAVGFAPVPANTWTTITIPISAASPNFVSFEGTDFATVFGSIGRLQLGVIPAPGLIGTEPAYTFDFTSITIVPGPSGAALLTGVGLLAVRRRRGAGQ